MTGENTITVEGVNHEGLVQTGDTTHPWIKRELPFTDAWSLQTDLELYGMQFGDYMTAENEEIASPISSTTSSGTPPAKSECLAIC